MTRAIRILACLFALGRCAAFVESYGVIRCSIVAPRNACPITPSGWYGLLGGVTCDRDCGPDGAN